MTATNLKFQTKGNKMKLVIITGGSKGLGKALTELYSETNEYHIVELSRSGSSKHNIYCDFTNLEIIEEFSSSLFEKLSEQTWDEIVYISNAGDVNPISSVSSLKTNDIIKNMSINQISAFTLISAFISHFRSFAGRKSIVNISSGAAEKGYAGWAMYCASKAASENFINALVIEEVIQAHPFIAVNYDPSVMDTGMQATIRNSAEEHFPAKKRFVDLKENEHLRQPEDVASDVINKINAGMVNNTRYSV